MYILVTRTLTIPNTTNAGHNNGNKNLIFKDLSPFTDYISKINNIEIDHTKYFDAVMPIYNLIEHVNNNLKISESLWKFYRDGPELNNNGVIV